MNEEEKSVSSQHLEALRHELREEMRKEFQLQLDSRTRKTNSRFTLDVVLIALGFVLFLLCLVTPALVDYTVPGTNERVTYGYNAAMLAVLLPAEFLQHDLIKFNGSFIEFFNDIFTPLLMGLVAMGNALLALSPLGLFLKRSKLYIVFALLLWWLGTLAAISIFATAETKYVHPHIGFFLWVLAFAVAALGYLVRYVRLCQPDVTRLVPLALAFMSITILLPGISLPALHLEGMVYKAKAFDASKGVIVDALVNKSGGSTDAERIKARNNAETMIDGLLQDLGLEGDAIQGTIKVYEEERSILTAVRELYKAGYGLVAFLVVLFSVVVPTVKACLIIAYSMTKKTAYGAITAVVSKWSMADVFAMALIIACLAANAYKFEGLLQMDARLEVGFYFFVAYCLLSIASSQVRITDLIERQLLSLKSAA